jgi:O-antigen ligase
MMPRVNVDGGSVAVAISRVSGPSLLRYCRWALAVTAACLPLYTVRWRAGPIPTTLLENLIMLTVALYVIGKIQVGTFAWPQRTGLEIPMAMVLLAGAIGIVVSPDHTGALGIYRAYFIEPVLIFYIAIDLMRSKQEIKVILLGLAIGSTIFAFMNYGAWMIALMHHSVATGNAPEALYTSPNSVAMYLEPPLCLAAGFALYADDRRDRRIALACLAILFVAFVGTLSRGGLLTLTVLAVVTVLTMPQLRLKLALIGAAIVGAIGLLQIPPIAQRLANQFDPNYRFNTFEGRLVIWRDTLHMLRDHPIFGAGLRGYEPVMAPYVTCCRISEVYPHDLWLSLWAELGLLGLFGFIALLVVLLWRGWRAFGSATGFYRPLLFGTSAAFVTVVVHGMFDTPYFKNDMAVEFWIVAALLIAAIRALANRATGNQELVR